MTRFSAPPEGFTVHEEPGRVLLIHHWHRSSRWVWLGLAWVTVFAFPWIFEAVLHRSFLFLGMVLALSAVPRTIRVVVSRFAATTYEVDAHSLRVGTRPWPLGPNGTFPRALLVRVELEHKKLSTVDRTGYRGKSTIAKLKYRDVYVIHLRLRNWQQRLERFDEHQEASFVATTLGQALELPSVEIK
jgi:hypothetical protein